MRLLVLLSAIAMPVVAWLSQRGVFGPDNVGGMKQAIQRIHEATA